MKGFGNANYEKQLNNTSSVEFSIGSVTKSFTAIAIMQLYEKGLLDINDPVSKYVTIILLSSFNASVKNFTFYHLYIMKTTIIEPHL